MVALSIILGIISITGFVFWIIGLKKMFASGKVEKREIDREILQTNSESHLTGFSKSVSYAKEKGYEIELKEGMTYSEIEDGLKTGNPDTITFVQIFAGFLFGLLGLLSCIGSVLVVYENSDGWFMICFSLFFFLLFGYIVIREKIGKNKKNIDSEKNKN